MDTSQISKHESDTQEILQSGCSESGRFGGNRSPSVRSLSVSINFLLYELSNE